MLRETHCLQSLCEVTMTALDCAPQVRHAVFYKRSSLGMNRRQTRWHQDASDGILLAQARLGQPTAS